MSENVQIALIGLFGTALTVGIPLIVKLLVEVLKMRTQVHTNHGKRPGEYLEMIADVKSGMDSLHGMVSLQGAQLDVLTVQLAEHTVTDEARFAQLQACVERLSERFPRSGHDGVEQR